MNIDSIKLVPSNIRLILIYKTKLQEWYSQSNQWAQSEQSGFAFCRTSIVNPIDANRTYIGLMPKELNEKEKRF
jgi:hypothetical protein